MIDVEFKPLSKDLLDFPLEQGRAWFCASYKDLVVNFRMNSDLKIDYITTSHINGEIFEYLGYDCSFTYSNGIALPPISKDVFMFITDVVTLNKHKIYPADFK